MNFYELLLTSKKSNTKRFSDLTEIEINRNEKELRLENKMDATSGLEALLNFIKAVREHPIGLDFLIDNPNLSQALFLQKPRFNTSDRMQIRGYQKVETREFFNQILRIELENAIGEAAAKNKYSRLAQIAKFNQYLPEDITLLLKSKASDTLTGIEMRVQGGVFGVQDDIEAIIPILIFLGDQNLIQKKNTIQNLVLANSLKDVGEPGIISFFKMFGEFFDAVGTTPTSLIEKEKKKETLKGCGCVFMVVTTIFLCCLVFVKYIMPGTNERNYPVNNKYSDEFQYYLTDFKRTDITDYQYAGPPYKGERSLDKQFGLYPEGPLSRGPVIINNSSYDLIVFSTENQLQMADEASAAATYISSGKSGYSGAFYVNRLYFGDSLSLFNTRYETTPVTTKRFLAQPLFSKKAIEYRIKFKNRPKIIIRDTLDRVLMDGRGSLEVYDCNGIREFKKLPFIFPPIPTVMD